MCDVELVDFFRQKVSQPGTGAAPEVHPIPGRKALFMLTTMKGKTRDLTVFVDSGCNYWVAQSQVPRQELESVKLSEGPFPVSVAGNQTIYAEAEYGALLPLQDGFFQVVRGLALDQVVSDMPEVNLTPVMTEIRRRYKNEQVIKEIRVPKKAGGRIDMILGIARG